MSLEKQLSHSMEILSTPDKFQQRKQTGALLVLFGGAHCGVCQVIKPKIEQLVSERFPEILLAYIECEQSPEICAQEGVFSLPVLKLFIDGQIHLELARNFSFQELGSRIERLYELWMKTR